MQKFSGASKLKSMAISGALNQATKYDLLTGSLKQSLAAALVSVVLHSLILRCEPFLLPALSPLSLCFLLLCIVLSQADLFWFGAG